MLENALREIRKRKAKRVFLQVPEGLKTRVLELAGVLERAGAKVFMSAEACYGGCDLRDWEAKKLGCDLIVHVGHSDFGLRSRVPVVYEEFRMDINPTPMLDANLDKLKPYKTISLVTTLQFLNSLEKAKRFLEARGKTIKIGSPVKAKYPGQVLGCDFSAAKPLEKLVDCFLFLGSGRFHPLGLSMEVRKPVLFLDFESGKLVDMGPEKQKLEKVRAFRAEKARDMETFGILVSTKPGQMKTKAAEAVKTKLEKKGKKAFLLIMDEIRPEKLLGIKLDCLVNCACPRLSEDYAMFKAVMLDPEDVDKL